MGAFLTALTIGSLAAGGLVAASSTPTASAATRLTCVPNGVVVTLPAGQTVSRLSRIDISNGAYTLIPIGNLNDAVNAIGYSTEDGFLYGTNQNGEFVQFGQDAGAGEVNLGYSTGGGAQLTSATWNNQFYNGVVGQGNVHYMIATRASDNVRYLIRTNLDARPLTSTLIRVTGALTGVPADMAFNPYDGLLYTEVSGVVYTINPSTGVTAAVTGVSGPVASGAGAAWTDSLGNLYFWDSAQGGVISKYNPRTKVAQRVANAGPQTGFDGTACLPPTMAKSVSPTNAKVGETVTFTFNIGNPGADQITTTDFVDTLPTGAGLEWVADGVTPASPGGGTVSVTGGTLRIDRLTVPAASSGLQSFSARARITNAAAAGNYINTATLDYNGTEVTSDDPNLPGNADGTAFRVRVPPTTSADTSTTAQDQNTTVTVLGNDGGNGTGTTLVPSSVRLTNSGGALVTTLTIPNEGTYTANSDGTVTFDPLPTFTGTATPVTYSVADSNNDRSTSTVTITVTAADDPTATADTPSTAYNTPVTINPTSNDDAGATNSSFVPGSVRLIDPDSGDEVTTVTVEDEGTYTVDTDTGEVTFTPVASFTGTAIPVSYTATTTFGGEVTSTITPTVTAPEAPTATDDNGSATYGKTVTLKPLGNDDSGPDGTTFVATSLRLIDPESGDAVTTVTVPDEGTWTVDTRTGEVTFTPDNGFSGDATPLDYRVTTNTGATATAALSATIGAPPGATADTGEARYNRAATVDVLDNDTPGTDATLDATSVRLTDGDGNRVTSLVVSGKGTWTVNATTGAVTFTPDRGFSGTVDVPYSVTDSNGDTASSTVTVTINPPPAADNDTATTPQNTAVTADVTANDDGGTAGLDETSVRLIDPDSGAQVTTLTVADEGTYTVDTTTGEVAFTPVASFSGTATPVTYSIADAQGTRDTATLTVTVTAAPAPTATPDTPTAAYNTPVTFNPTANDTSGATTSTFIPASVRLIDPTTGDEVTTVTIDGEGAYTVDSDTGEVTFTPVPTFTGTGTPLSYTATTTFGGDVRSTITPTIGEPGTATATDDSGSGTYGAPVTVDPLTNDSTGDPGVTFTTSTLRLIDPATGNPVTTVVVAGEGTWQVDTTTGQVTFTPEDGFDGPTTPLGYQVETSAGDTVTARITVTSGNAPTATADSMTVPFGSAATVDVLGNDTAGTGATKDPGSVRLRDGDGNSVTSLEVTGKGTWTVNPTTGAITFTPAEGFSGTVTAPYGFTDSDGNTAASTVTVTIAGPPTAAPDVKTGPQGHPVTLRPLANDTRSATGAALDPATLRLIDPATGDRATRVAVNGQGVWAVDGDGVVTFTPEDGFTGTATPLGYTAADSDGVEVRSTVTVTIVPTPPVARNDSGSGKQGQPVTINPLGNDQAGIGNLDPTSVRLIGPDGKLVTTVRIDGEGTYTVNTITGAITFTPERGFTGKATVRYSVANTDGVRAAASVTFSITGTPGITPNPPSEGGGVTVTLPGGGQLAYTGAQGIAGLSIAALGLVILGLALTIIRRRRREDTN